MVKEIYPKNKEHLKKLIPFAQRIIKLCKENGIDPIVYGSFAHFYHTKDKNMNVNDIDMIIPKKDFPKIEKALRKNTDLKITPDGGTIIIEKGKLKVELDEQDLGPNKNLTKQKFSTIDFYGIDARIIDLKSLERIYPIAYHDSIRDRDKILGRIKSLEKFLGRKIKQDIFVDIVKSKNLSNKDKKELERFRVKEFGEKNRKDFKKDYEPDTLWFMVKEKGKIVSFGGIRPVKVRYKNKNYNIGGVCSTISVVKKKGYGRIMVHALIDYSLKSGKTILGFTGKTEFFKKVGMGAKKNFIRRFIWLKDGKEVYDNDGDGIYYEGKDKLISKMLKTKLPAYIFVEFW